MSATPVAHSANGTQTVIDPIAKQPVADAKKNNIYLIAISVFTLLGAILMPFIASGAVAVLGSVTILTAGAAGFLYLWRKQHGPTEDATKKEKEAKETGDKTGKQTPPSTTDKDVVNTGDSIPPPVVLPLATPAAATTTEPVDVTDRTKEEAKEKAKKEEAKKEEAKKEEKEKELESAASAPATPPPAAAATTVTPPAPATLDAAPPTEDAAREAEIAPGEAEIAATPPPPTEKKTNERPKRTPSSKKSAGRLGTLTRPLQTSGGAGATQNP